MSTKKYSDELVVDDSLVLKVPELSDAEEIFNCVEKNREYLRCYLPWLDRVQSVQDEEGFLKFIRSGFEEGKMAQFGIWFKGKFVGVVGFHEFASHIGTIGYWMSQAVSGMGLMSKSVEKIIEYGFSERNLHRIVICCGTKNSKSQKIPERFGFTFEGVTRDAEYLYDHYVSHKIYSMLKPEWDSLKEDAETQ
eukprot:Nk52_evm10s490 gene=Nk52_evmTU10s490